MAWVIPPHGEGIMSKDRNILRCQYVMPPSCVSELCHCERKVSGYPKVHTPAAPCPSCWGAPCAIAQSQ